MKTTTCGQAALLLALAGCSVNEALRPAFPSPPPPPALAARPDDVAEDEPQGHATQQRVWGIAGIRVYGTGDQVAPDGIEYKPLFALDMDFNLWLWADQGLYAFAEGQFWGQRAAPGVTNASQGEFDFSKRELDFTLGAAWNYWGPLEARLFGYSFNNLNRGTSEVHPSGYNDGIGLENRWYLGATYANLGTEDFDTARATFVSAGYYPTKDMVDGQGNDFKPGLFARAYLTLDLCGDWCYLYEDTQIIARQEFPLKLLKSDFGGAVRPCARLPRLEFRAGCDGIYDLGTHDLEWGVYGAVRYLF